MRNGGSRPATSLCKGWSGLENFGGSGQLKEAPLVEAVAGRTEPRLPTQHSTASDPSNSAQTQRGMT
jgi:hypothetical protein